VSAFNGFYFSEEVQCTIIWKQLFANVILVSEWFKSYQCAGCFSFFAH